MSIASHHQLRLLRVRRVLRAAALKSGATPKACSYRRTTSLHQPSNAGSLSSCAAHRVVQASRRSQALLPRSGRLRLKSRGFANKHSSIACTHSPLHAACARDGLPAQRRACLAVLDPACAAQRLLAGACNPARRPSAAVRAGQWNHDKERARHAMARCKLLSRCSLCCSTSFIYRKLSSLTSNANAKSASLNGAAL